MTYEALAPAKTATSSPMPPSSVVAAAADQTVVAVRADERVGARAAVERVVAGLPLEEVRCRVAGDRVVAAAALGVLDQRTRIAVVEQRVGDVAGRHMGVPGIVVEVGKLRR